MRIPSISKVSFLLLFFGIYAQSQVQQLDEVVLRAQRINSAIQPLSVTIVSDSLQLLLQQDIGERLHSVAGLFVSSQQNFTQDTRISIRGFGARAAFGIRGIKIILDGIPVTTPDGQTQLDHIPLSQLGAMEVIRGLSGGLYGNASGGVVLLNSSPIKTQKSVTIGFADFESRTISATVSEAREKNRFRAIVAHKAQQGYRAWSAYENTLVSLSNTFVLGQENQLTLDYSFFNSPFAQDAGGLTLAEVTQNRKQARQANTAYKAGENVKQHYFSARWKINKWTSHAFYANRQLDALLPFVYGGQIDLGRHYFGLGAHRGGTKNQWKWHYGIESSAQLDLRKRFKNNLGAKGGQTLNQKERFYSLGAYGVIERRIADWRVRGALRNDMHQITLTDLLDTNSDKKTISVLSPSIAVHRQLTSFFSGYMRWGTSFETPSLNELSANPSGKTGFNPTLQAQKSYAYEVGLRHRQKAFRLALVLFHTTTNNEILPYEIEQFPGQTFYTNAGRTQRKGMELEGLWKLFDKTNLTLAFGHGSYQTEDKKALPNVPQQQLNTSIQHHFKKGVFVVSLKYIGDRYADNANNVQVPSFWTSDASFQYYWGRVRATLGVTNLANVRYFDNIRINAFGGRYYEPAATRQSYFRLTMSL